jgi:translation initiation factor 2B subunit (eIF-2B alpha/beta/delta family)
VTLLARAQLLAEDRDRGASEILSDLLPLLADALGDGQDAAQAVVRVVCRGQPVMAPLWNACAAALADGDRPGRFERARGEMTRAPSALARSAASQLSQLVADAPDATLITLSFSGSVAAAVAALASRSSLSIVCGEGRPRYEGRRMAATLARAGARVTLTTDAAVTVHLTSATAVVLGADAVAQTYWINKVGSFGLAAAAARCGVPVYVIAARDKALADPLARSWPSPRSSADDVWAAPPTAIHCDNPLFERIPADLVTLFLTDAGPVTPEDLNQVSERYLADISKLVGVLGG